MEIIARLTATLLLTAVLASPVRAQEMVEDSLTVEPSTTPVADASEVATQVETRVRPDVSVVLFDYQLVNETLTSFEGSVMGVVTDLNGLTGTFFACVCPSLFREPVNGWWVRERGLWKATAVPDPPRGLPEFHQSQELLKEAQRGLTSVDQDFQLGGLAEVMLRFSPNDEGALKEARSARERIRDKILQASELLKQSRQSLEEARSALLAP